MQDTSAIANYDTIASLDDFTVETKVNINGVDYTKEDVYSVDVYTALFKDAPSVGNCRSSEIDVELITPEATIPRMAEIKPYVRLARDVIVQYVVINGGLYSLSGIVSGTGATITSQVTVEGTGIIINNSETRTYSGWLQKGHFFIDTRSYTISSGGQSVMEIHGYDAMLKAEQIYPVNDLDYPKPDIEVVELIARTLGVSVDLRTYDIMTGNYQINLPATYTMREVLGYIASMYAGNFIISPLGELRLVGLTVTGTSTNILVDESGDYIVFGEDRILV